jgi:putative nucleotidyltransferase with HDIG domain
MLPFALFAVILQSFFKNSLAVIIFMVMMMSASLFAPNGMEFIWIEAPSGLMAVLLLKNLRKRSQLLGVIAIVFVSSSLLYFASSIIKEGHLVNVVNSNFGLFAASSMLTIIAIPMVYIIERLFGLISEMALLELADTNNTLLRELSRVAPGTFQHSMQVANLAEECALEIGGDALLMRTGALYHDIGKMKNPSFFIENQAGGHNPHNDLSEEESAKIIISHVIQGVEMAKKHKLPEKIIDFIRTHHGTTTTRYFYFNAKKKDDTVKMEDFQYPGPLPFSKETAILMLCDGVEAAARSLPEYSAESIQNLINGIFSTILDSNQLDHAPITLKDITILKKLLQKKIMNIYHVRVAYPSA